MRGLTRRLLLVALLGATSLLPGCSLQKTVGGWFGGEPTPAPGERGQVFYVGTAGLRVYSQPSASSEVIGELGLHERVTRYKIERGYAYVRAERSGVTGWVNNASLVWRVPGATPAAKSEPTPAASEVEEPTQAPVEAPPPPSDTPATERRPTPTGPAPSLFDPY